MATLDDLPELIGFFSYSREDDDDAKGALSALRDRIGRELRGQLGRSRAEFRLWQDRAALGHGVLWEEEIKSAIAQSVFFIPIVTPSSLRSKNCKFEFDLFLAREAELGRKDLIFPILYIRVPALEDERLWRQNDVLNVVGSRQYLNWQPMRFLDIDTPEPAIQVELYCANIYRALQQPWLTPEERRDEAALREAEERRIQEEAQARQREAERRTEEQRQRSAAAEKLAAERARVAAEEERQHTAAAEKLAAERTAAAAYEERRKAAEARAEHDRKVALAAAARAAKEAQRLAENAAKDTPANAEDVALRGAYPSKPTDVAPAATTEEQEKIKPVAGSTWKQKFDVKSWSYIKIAVVAALFGMFSGLIGQAHPSYVLFGPIYLLQLTKVVYTGTFFLLVTGLTNNPGRAKSVLYLLLLYCIELGLSRLATLLGEMPGDALWMLIEWLVVAAAFLSFGDCLRDWKMLLIALAVGACQGLYFLALRGVISLNTLTLFFNEPVAYVTTALCLSYGIRRCQKREGHGLSLARAQ